ncbi:phage-related minor tail protein [Bradyrhizobium sp. USDA 4452]
MSKESEEANGARSQAGPGTGRRGQDYEVSYEAKKTGKSAASVKKAVKKVGNSRKQVERRLGSAMKKSLGATRSRSR